MLLNSAVGICMVLIAQIISNLQGFIRHSGGKIAGGMLF
jgi:hypothetical protein